MSHPHAMYINGEWCAADDGRTVGIINPATAEIIEQVPYGTAAETLRAIEAAQVAFNDWRHRTAYERAAVLLNAAQLIRDRADDMARLLTMEVGKTLAESKGEILGAAAQYEWYAEQAKRIYGRWVPPPKQGVRRWVLRHPVGVCAVIFPWNFPVLLASRKIAPALAAGCTVVVRPPTQSCLAAAELIGCLADAGLPPGIVNFVTGPATEIGGTFMQDARVRKVSFTGSTAVGKELVRQSAQQLKKLSLELGGSAPVLIFPDIDPREAARLSALGKFRNNGQVCISPARFYAHESIAQEYTEACVGRARSMKLGNGLDEGTDIGPLFDEEGVKRAETFVQDAISKGARLLCGGERAVVPGLEQGFFFQPTVLVEIPPTARLTCEETFSPILPIMTFRDTEEAIRLANATTYGLAAYVMTKDLSTAIHVAEELEFGIIGLNDMVPASAEAPFGGMKESGLGGREGGLEGVEPYLETKYISVGL